MFHFGKRRLGEDVREAEGLPGLYSVDAGVADTSLLGHSYYGSVPSILDDIKGVLKELSPEQRQLVVIDRTHERWSFKIANPQLPLLLQGAALLFFTVLAVLLGRWSRRRVV